MKISLIFCEITISLIQQRIERNEKLVWVVGMVYGNGNLKVMKILELEGNCRFVVLKQVERWDAVLVTKTTTMFFKIL